MESAADERVADAFHRKIGRRVLLGALLIGSSPAHKIGQALCIAAHHCADSMPCARPRYKVRIATAAQIMRKVVIVQSEHRHAARDATPFVTLLHGRDTGMRCNGHAV